MRLALSASALAVTVLALAACGGSGSTTSTGSRGAVPRSHSRPSHLYRVTMAGAAEMPRGAPHATGAAVIAFHGASEVCWRFAHLHGFTGATVAHIHAGTTGHSGHVVVPLSTGSRLHHQGCVHVSPAVTKAIAATPSAYYVNIHSAQYPAGAVRGQL